MSQLHTPRTEAFIDSCGDYEQWVSYRERLHAFARTLELETIALKKERDELVKAFRFVRYTHSPIFTDEYDQWKARLDEADALLAKYPESESPSPRFPYTECSQCGGRFGPGDHGYSHCESHKGKPRS